MCVFSYNNLFFTSLLKHYLLLTFVDLFATCEWFTYLYRIKMVVSNNQCANSEIYLISILYGEII